MSSPPPNNIFTVIMDYDDVGMVTPTTRADSLDALVKFVVKHLMIALESCDCGIVDDSRDVVNRSLYRDVSDFVTQRFFDSDISTTVGSKTGENTCLDIYGFENYEVCLNEVLVTKVVIPTDEEC